MADEAYITNTNDRVRREDTFPNFGSIVIWRIAIAQHLQLDGFSVKVFY
jgi:hypothetical protein